jgi:hypothetical protein
LALDQSAGRFNLVPVPRLQIFVLVFPVLFLNNQKINLVIQPFAFLAWP